MSSTEEFESEFYRTRLIVIGFINWLKFCLMDTARDPKFTDQHLLSFLHQDILETLYGVLAHLKEGIHTPPIRESRYLLELSIKIAIIQNGSYSSTIEQKLNQFDHEIKSTSISPMKSIPLDYLHEETKVQFLQEVGRLYGAASNFVHVSPQSIQYRQNRVIENRTVGFESIEDLAKVNDQLRSMYAAALVFLSHSVPQYVIGDWHVQDGVSLADWYYLKSRYIAEIDATLDYKHERQEDLEALQLKRNSEIEF